MRRFHLFIDQALDAATLVLGIALGTGVARLYDARTALLALGALVAATLLVPSQRATSIVAPRFTGALAVLLALVQRFVIYAIAFAARQRIGALFGGGLTTVTTSVTTFAMPLLTVALVAALYVAFSDAWRRDATDAAPASKRKLATPLSVTEHFVEALAFAYGIGADKPPSLVWLALVVLAVAAAWLHAHVEDARSRFGRWLCLCVDFCEQYVVYAMTRLVYADRHVRASTLCDSMLVACIGAAVHAATLATAASHAASPQKRLFLTGVLRRLLERYLDALAIVAALARSVQLASRADAAFQLAAHMLLFWAVSGVALPTSLSSQERFYVALGRLLALVSRYASYACVQVVLARSGGHLSTTAALGCLLLVAARFETPETAAAVVAMPSTHDLAERVENAVEDAASVAAT